MGFTCTFLTWVVSPSLMLIAMALGSLPLLLPGAREAFGPAKSGISG